jgi:hypothetical protein
MTVVPVGKGSGASSHASEQQMQPFDGPEQQLYDERRNEVLNYWGDRYD